MGKCEKCGQEVPDDKMAEHAAACQGGGQPEGGEAQPSGTQSEGHKQK